MAGTWAPCPFGRHEYRYFDGQRWTEHVSDGGQQSVDVVDAVPGEAIQGVLASVETRDISSGEVLWSGQSNSLSTMVTGGRMVEARYRLTRDALYFDIGTFTTRSEMIPLWGVVDVDVMQSITQKPRGVGDVRVHVDSATASRFGQRIVTIQAVADPHRVRALILEQVTFVRRQQFDRHHDREVRLRQAGASSHTVNFGAVGPAMATPPATPALPSGPQQSLAEQLRELAALRDAGVLTDSEFDQQKARLLTSGISR